jgi:hypothetical protein
MKCKLLAATVITLLIISFFANNSSCSVVTAPATPNVYVGIDAAYGDLDKIKELVNNVSSYTNLFVMGSVGLSLVMVILMISFSAVSLLVKSNSKSFFS